MGPTGVTLVVSRIMVLPLSHLDFSKETCKKNIHIYEECAGANIHYRGVNLTCPVKFRLIVIPQSPMLSIVLGDFL